MCHSVILHPYITCVALHNSTSFLQGWVKSSLTRGGALSLQRPQSATLLAATRGRRRLFPAFPLLLLRLVRQKAGERLCTWDERHRQAFLCGGQTWEKSSNMSLIWNYLNESLSEFKTKKKKKNHTWLGCCLATIRGHICKINREASLLINTHVGGSYITIQEHKLV